MLENILSSCRAFIRAFTEPVPPSSTVYLLLRICAIGCGLSALLCFVNNYDLINCVTHNIDVSLPPTSDADSQTHNFLKAASTMCYMQSAFVVVNITDDNVSHFGMEKNEQLIYTEYYQWVPFVLACLCCALTVPEKLWEATERAFSAGVMNELDKRSEEAHVLRRIEVSTHYFVRGLGSRRSICFFSAFYEYLSVAALWASILTVHVYLGGRFLQDLPKGLYILLSKGFVPYKAYMHELFPKVVKCTFRHFGFSGTLQNKDFLCTLPRNVLYEKFFVFLWLILLFSVITSSAVVLLHTLLLVSSSFRKRYILLVSKAFDSPSAGRALKKILLKTSVSDEYLLLHLRSRMTYYEEWLQELGKKLQG